VIEQATCIKYGTILDEKIILFQKRVKAPSADRAAHVKSHADTGRLGD
jgi:hypothetical protein